MRISVRSIISRLSRRLHVHPNVSKTVITSHEERNQLPLLLLLITLLILTVYLISIPLQFKRGLVAYPNSLYMLSAKFYILFIVWLSVIFAVILYKRTANRFLVYPFLVIVISAVFYGYWIIQSPSIYGPDGFDLVYTSNYFLSNCSIGPYENLPYSQWPGFLILQTFLISITGNAILVQKVLSLTIFLLFPVLFYYWLRIEMDSKLAFVGSLLFMQANLRLSSKPYASPYSFDLVLFLIFLIMISKTGKKGRISAATMFMLGSVIIISHPITGLCLISLVGIYFFLTKKLEIISSFLYFSLLLVFWLTFYASPDYIIKISNSISRFFAHGFEYTWLLHFTGTHIAGGRMPFWTTVQRLTLYLTVIILSGIWIWQFIKKSIRSRSFYRTFKGESTGTIIALGFVLAIPIFSIPLLLYVTSGFIHYVWFFSLLPLCFLAMKVVKPSKKTVTVVMTFALLLLPISFIANYYKVNTYIVREPELAGAEFIKSSKEIVIVTDFSSSEILRYFTSHVIFETTAPNVVINPRTEFILRLRAGNIQGDLFYYSLRTKDVLTSSHNLDSRDLETLERNVDSFNNRVYDNNLVCIWAEKTR